MKKSKSRIKIPLHTLQTRDDAEAAMNSLALAVNNQRKLIAQRDAQVLAINQEYELRLAPFAEYLKEKSDALRAWAEANPAEFPAGRKSIQFPSGTLGFRTGTPKLALLSRAWNWDKVLFVLRGVGKWVRTKVEIDKEAILTEVALGKYCNSTLSSFGLKVVQDEGFFIDPALTDTDARQTVKSEAA